MNILNLFKSSDTILKEKVIFTQKARISSLERELNDVKLALKSKDSEINESRANFERSKERLVDQIVELSDKFAELNHSMIGLANDIRAHLARPQQGSAFIEDRSSKKKKR